jgi:flagellar hook-associated protein 3 FlgL
MRVNPNPLPDLLSALEQTQQQINTDEQQVASGQSVNLPSDNPANAALLVTNANQTADADQYLRSLGSIQGEMQNADSALSSVVTLLQRAISLGTEGANGTNNDSDRLAVASELQGIQSQLVGLANLSYQGNYVFAGTATQTAPYVLDATSPSGVDYVGNSNTNQIAVGDNLNVQTNLPGSQLFSNPGTDVFQAIHDLITSLQNDSNISGAVSEVSSAYDYVNTQRVFYGNAIDGLDTQQTYLNSETTQLAEQQSNLAGTNLPQAITNLESSETADQATLEVISQTEQNNLFSYLGK